MKRNVVALAPILLVAFFAQSVLAQSAIETALAATVTIEVAGPDGLSHGSGFITSSDGIIITAAHVIDGATSALVRLQNGEELNVEGVIAIDAVKDFAIVRVAGFDLPTVPLGNADDVSVGQRVIVIGAPIDPTLAGTVSDGLVAASRLIDGTRMIQISAPTSPGNSGGPVLTEQGQVIGLVVSGINAEGAENLNFALPINYVRGQLALAATKPLQPLAEVQVTAGAGVTERSRASTSSALPRMNTDLRLDADALHGTSYWQTGQRETSSGHRYRTRISTAYAVRPLPYGGRKLERVESTEWWGNTSDLYKGCNYATPECQKVYTAYSTSFINLDGSGAGTNYRGTPNHARWAGWAHSWGWSASGSSVVVDSAGVWSREFPVHPGIIPGELVSGIIAAMDSLPAVPGEIQLWVGGYDANQGRFVENVSVVQLMRTVTVEHIRVPESMGERCERGVKLLSGGITEQAIESSTGAQFRVQKPHVNVQIAQRDGYWGFQDRVGRDGLVPCLSFRQNN